MPNIETIVQAGAVGIAILLIWLCREILKSQKGEREMFMTTVRNHIDHATETQDKSNEIQRKQTGALQRLSGVIESLDKRLNGKK